MALIGKAIYIKKNSCCCSCSGCYRDANLAKRFAVFLGPKNCILDEKTVFSPIVQYTCVVINLEKKQYFPKSGCIFEVYSSRNSTKYCKKVTLSSVLEVSRLVLVSRPVCIVLVSNLVWNPLVLVLILVSNLLVSDFSAETSTRPATKITILHKILILWSRMYEVNLRTAGRERHAAVLLLTCTPTALISKVLTVKVEIFAVH